MQQVKPKKALGQHFLTDLSIAERIASTLDDYRGLPVMEVGPGMGVLTRFLISGGHDVTVAEIDGESVEYLRENFPELGERILDCDFLKTDLNEVFPGDGQFCVIGNYPYNISSQIFFHVLDYRDRVVCCSGMLQREVAERLAAAPGTKARGILSVLLQAWYDVEYLFTVEPGVFNPPPKVKSGVIKMTRNGVTDLGCDPKLFKTVVKTTFGQRRKTIRNSLKGLIAPGASMPESPLLAMRPEQLSVEQFVALTNIVGALRGASATSSSDQD
ncbi:MAG: 16S rRNA (adenine(1518)-N(6)/adenine(1519)-N(6))-dimethyltransferase RsmA [Bacteroides sp.]|nr:16S rRNA (adenine(1518)-N(6)/adenine(1519)-N(6))-dimethyltransferase RsmA [Bacteroides sp.]MBD5331998.1 16S rRNA (adenine(1518)-N(6)/adenine(1519)-N(6))-dimethyltransferase RsmA [Bacteroides sp.]MBD5374188.1 16S rRNA (adenine(1518)-N(6)/adenine(1519)-N(6))-dimethyltransferase RsmA [Bacteroides sp.]MDE7460839.1 16S rRNA (adenine(1518)-N(6)/adenine(1519)-N(6))-dimethyltransferase RsmA [Paramuribaculum sp.]